MLTLEYNDEAEGILLLLVDESRSAVQSPKLLLVIE